MLISRIALVLALGIGLSSCDRDGNGRRDSPDARQAGREAYRAAQAAKRDLKDAERELQNAGKEFREGWTEAKHKDKASPKKD
jgi:hypothetical protein